jgi:hypothetical protein
MAPRIHKLRHSTNGMARQRSEGHFRAINSFMIELHELISPKRNEGVVAAALNGLIASLVIEYSCLE